VELSSRFGANEMAGLQILSEDGGLVFGRTQREAKGEERKDVLIVTPASEQPAPITLGRLVHEYSLREELDSTWAVRPVELLQDRGQTILVLDDPGGELLSGFVGTPMEIGRFLRIAVSIAACLGKLHRQGLTHKDIKPANILMSTASDEVWLTGFRVASRLAHERQSVEAPEVIAGTLAYMAPEQTGRMNRSVDSRSDLYSLGVTFYEMLIGSLPFSASYPMEWVHCHIARKPVSPSDRLDTIPAPVSAIVMKLLAKTAEERYQTAAGLERDLRRCLAEWTQGALVDFSPGQEDTSDRLLIPEKLYGREREVETLLASFDRIVKSGAPELVLVSGYSGIGKSSVVNELHKALVPPRGIFASGKFDQYKRDIPYATVAQAFQSLIRQILSKSEAELQIWREALREALGSNGRLIVDLIPELELVIGEQPPVADLSPQDARRRYQMVLRRFIGIFARPEHPLALFLDDLQWLDAATLDLLEDLLVQPDIRHLLLIGAYRDNEVDAAHPLMRKIETIRRAGTPIQDIVLVPLTYDDLTQLVSDSIRCGSEPVTPLVQLVHEKTGGNPFFAVQFLSALADEELLIFDHTDARWIYDLGRIRAKGYTDNVVDLMVTKLGRLPTETLAVLQQLACVGFDTELALLETVCQTSQAELHDNLWEAVRSGLVHRSENAYAFQHDRIQEAAYSLVPEDARAGGHLRIGRLLLAHTPLEKREEIIFDMVNQYNRGAKLIVSEEERFLVAELNLIAGKRAKGSTAYASALNYLIAGVELLGDHGWESRHALTFALELERAGCEFLTGEITAADDRLSALSNRAATTVERAALACLHMDVCMTRDQNGRAVAVALQCLRHVGIDSSPNPTEQEARQEYDRMWLSLRGRDVAELIDLPVISEPRFTATLDVLERSLTPALFTDANLLSVLICKLVSLSLEHGHTGASCTGYIWLGMIAGPQFGNYKAGLQFGQLGYDLTERHGLERSKALTYLSFGVIIIPWSKHVRAGAELIRQAFDAANAIGDLTTATSCGVDLFGNLLVAGDSLADVQREAERSLEFAQKTRSSLWSDISATQLALVRTLRGLTTTFGCFNNAQFDELQIENRLSTEGGRAIAACWYWVRKLQARFFAGDYVTAVAASLNAQRLLWTSPSFLETAEAHFYGALSHAASCDAAFPVQYSQHVQALTAHHTQLVEWAENCPENFENRALLVAAEIARIEGRELDAEHLYEEAIKSARENEFIHNEALAHELAARFYAARGFVTIANAYMREARSCYHRWGADGKVRQLDGLYPHLATSNGQHSVASIGSVVEHLDTASVIKASQALSTEIELPNLIDRLMTIAIENAGANRGLLILPSEDEYLIRAEARTDDDHIEVTMCQEPITGIACPQSLVRYVIRSRESVILDDASKLNMFSDDDYLCERQSRSILCLPLVKQQQLTGILLLENTLTSHAFTADRIAVLELIAAQAAISLENSRLYGELLQSGADLRLQVELLQQLPVSAWTLKPDGTPDFVNRVWLEFAGQTLDFVRSHPEAWMTAVHPEDREFAAKSFWKGVQSNQGFAFETRTLRAQDGVYRRHLHQTVVLRDAEGKVLRFVGTTTDIDDQKRAEEALREAAAQLAHANRVATMGQLTASIAHEVNQPIAAAMVNAGTAARWLNRQPPNLEEARLSIERISSDSKRAADIVGRIREFSRKAPLRKADFEINEAILDIMGLARVPISDNGVIATMQLADGLPHILGDRVQLQQVILNLIMNAIEAMSDGGARSRELLVSTSEAESGAVLIGISDSGAGLPQDNPERIFEAFYTTKASGLGMGLAVCRSIIDAHGGRLWAAPNEPRGTVFFILLPVGDKDG
jgi:PAS domain S-box-containing protein